MSDKPISFRGEMSGFGWDVNPWVAALTFDVHRCNIDEMEGG